MTNQKLVYNSAVRLLSRRRYHSSEMFRKLKMKGNDDEDIQSAIEKLKALNYLNDEEYIQLYVTDQLRFKPQGGRLIRLRLLQKGISKDEVEGALNKLKINESEQAQEALQKKIRTLKSGTPQQQKEKLYRFLGSRGFNGNIISKTIKSYFEPLQN